MEKIIKAGVISRLSAVCFLAALLRLIFLLCFLQYEDRAKVYVDSDQYVSMAQSLIAGKGYATSDGAPQAYRLPGLSSYLALFYTWAGQSSMLPLVVQAVIAAALPALIFFSMMLLWPGQQIAALVAALLAAVHPGFIIYAGMIATESFSTVFLLVWFLFFLQMLLHSRIFAAAGAGVSLGVLSLIRPVGHFTLFLSLFFICIFYFFQRHKINNVTRVFVTYLGSWVVIVAPWLIRNYCLFGALFFHSLPGLHFLQYTATQTLVAAQGGSYATVRMRLIEAWQAKQRAFESIHNRKCNEYDAAVLGERMTSDVFLQHPLHALRYTFIQWIKTVTSPYSVQLLVTDAGTWHDHAPGTTELQKLKKLLFPKLNTPWLIFIIWLDLLMQFFLMLGVVIALCFYLFRRVFLVQFTMLALIIGLFVGMTAAYGCARLRHPIEPFFIMIACMGYLLLYKELYGSET